MFVNKLGKVMNNLSSAVSTQSKLQMAFNVRLKIGFREIESFEFRVADFSASARQSVVSVNVARIMTFVERVKTLRDRNKMI